MSQITPLVRILFAAPPVFDLLKATAKKMIVVPGHYKNGHYVDPYQKMVHYNPEVSFHAVATGQGSHSQKAAHKELSGMDWWDSLSVDDKALHVMALATDKQDAASASAAVSQWKATAMAGQNPKAGQWAAFMAQPGTKQAALYDAVKAKAGGLSHLKMPASVPVPVTPDPVPAAASPEAQKPETKEAPAGVSVADSAINSVVAYSAEKVMALGYKLHIHESGKVYIGSSFHDAPRVWPDKDKAALAIAKLKDAGVNASMSGAFVVVDAPVPAASSVALPEAGDPADVSSPKTMEIGGVSLVAVKKQSPNSKNQSYWIPSVAGTGQEISHQHYASIKDMWGDLGKLAKIKGDKFAWNLGVETAAPAVGPISPALSIPSAGKDIQSAGTAYVVPEGVQSAGTDTPSAGTQGTEPDYGELLSAMATGAFYQKEAIAKLKGSGWHELPLKAQYEQAHALYQKLQGAASAAAAVSGFKKSMLAGKVPTPSQYKAMQDASSAAQAKVVDACVAAIGEDKYVGLLKQASAIANAAKSTGLPAHLAAVAPKLQAAMDAKATVTDVTPAGYGPTEAPGPLHTFTNPEEGLATFVTPSKKHKGMFDVAMKDIDSGKVLPTVNTYKTEAVAIEHAKKAAGVKPKEGDTKVENGKNYRLHKGHWIRVDADGQIYMPKHLGALAFDAGLPASAALDKDFMATYFPEGKLPGGAAATLKQWQEGWVQASLAAKVPKMAAGPTPLNEKPAYDHIGQEKASKQKAGHTLPMQDNFVKLAAQNWLAANPGGEAEMHEALAAHKQTHLTDSIGMQTKPPAPAGPSRVKSVKASAPLKAVPVGATLFHNTTAGHNKFWSVSSQGGVMKTVYGKIGTKGTSTEKVYPSKAEADAAVDKMIAAKKKDGYVFAGPAVHEHKVVAPAVAPVAPAGAPGAPGAPVPPTFSGDLAGEYNMAVTQLAKEIDQGEDHSLFNAHINNKNGLTESQKKLTAYAMAGLLHLGISPAYFAVDWAKVPYHPNYWDLINAAKTGDLAAIKQVPTGNVAAFKKTKATLIAALSGLPAAPAVASVKATPADVKATPAPTGHHFPAGWEYDEENQGMSGAATLMYADSKTGYMFYAAFDKNDGLQVGMLDDEHNPMETESPSNSAAAAAQLAGWMSFSQDNVTPVTAADIEKLSIGPKDGDTKYGANDVLLVFKNGRWHKSGEAPTAAGPSIALPDFSDDTSKFGPIYAKAAQQLKEAFEDGGAAAVKKLIVTHKTGGKAGKYSMTLGGGKLTVGPKDDLPRRVKMYKFIVQLLASKAGHKVGGAPSVVAAPKVASVAASTGTATPIKTAAAVLGGGTNIDGWTQVGPQQGSNPGGKFKDASGVDWYCKFPASIDVAKNELLSAKFYQMLGVTGPNIKLVNKGGKVGVAAKWVDVKKGSPAQLAKAAGTHDAFVIDAWLANWDVVGAANDNLMLGKNGEAVRVDVGGSLLYRAQGVLKGDAFGTEVTELSTLLDAGTNAQSAAVFAGASKSSMAWGLKQLAKMKPSQIIELCDKVGPGDEATRKALAAKLIARRANILQKMGVSDPWDKPKVNEAALKVNATDLPKPVDFANFKGTGQGLSSVAKVNEQNSIDSAALIAFAAQGNLTALKNYQYDAFDKGTGASIGKKPITEHPAKDIKAQWAGLVETLSSIAYPPAEALEMVSSGMASSLEELSENAGYFNPEDRVETISADHRMGFFMKLGAVDDVHDLLAGQKWSFLTENSKWVKDAKQGFSKLGTAVRAYISGVQSSGWVNHIFSQGKSTVSLSGHKGSSYDGGVQTLASKIYAEALPVPAGTVLHRFMNDTTANKSMTQQFLNAKPGLIIQNTDSMCASYNENHSWSGDVQLKIRCAEGCKATASFASGNYSNEYEVTTLPGQRFVVLEVVKKGDNKVMVDVLMLPPHEGYVTALGKLAVLGKSMVLFMGKSWHKRKLTT